MPVLVPVVNCVHNSSFIVILFFMIVLHVLITLFFELALAVPVTLHACVHPPAKVLTGPVLSL